MKLGIDIGGTKVAVCLADAQGIRGKLVEPTARGDRDDALATQLLRLARTLAQQAGLSFADIDAVGIASAGPFRKQQGSLALVSPNICFAQQAIPLEQQLRAHFRDVRIVNDCVAALMAERLWGAAQGINHAAYVTWSTGIGFAFCVDGQMLAGKNGNAGHAGHAFVDRDDDLLCGCGNRGDVEAMIGGAALDARNVGGIRQLFADYRAGNAAAIALVHTAASRFGRALYNAVVSLDLELLVLGGSVWLRQQDVLAPLVLRELHGRLPALTDGVQLVTAALGEQVTDLGALSLVIPAEWAERWRSQPWW